MPIAHITVETQPLLPPAKLGKTPVRTGALAICLFGQDLIWVCRSGCGCNEKIKNPSLEMGGGEDGEGEGVVSKERNG
jgi:hypothetical protein